MATSAKKDRGAVRLTIDIPTDQHTYIKMLATAEGISLRRFVIAHLPSPEDGSEKQKNIPKGKFGKLFKEFLSEKSEMLKRLADK
jgi:hypothetical protein